MNPVKELFQLQTVQPTVGTVIRLSSTTITIIQADYQQEYDQIISGIQIGDKVIIKNGLLSKYPNIKDIDTYIV